MGSELAGRVLDPDPALEPPGRASETTGRASELAARVSESAGRVSDHLEGPRSQLGESRTIWKGLGVR